MLAHKESIIHAPKNVDKWHEGGRDLQVKTFYDVVATLRPRFLVDQPLTPRMLVNEISGHLHNVSKTATIAVLFTIEWAADLKLHGYDNVTIITADYDKIVAALAKQVNIEYKLFSEIVDMKFDIVVGNPPFSDRVSSNSSNSKDLDTVFFLKSLTLADHVTMIIRSNHFAKPGSVFRKTLFNSGNISQIAHIDKKHFPSVARLLCVVTIKPNVVETEVTLESGETSRVALNENIILNLPQSGICEINSTQKSLASRWIHGAVTRQQMKLDENGVEMIEIMGTGTGPVVKRVAHEQAIVGLGTHGVVMNINNSFGALNRMHIKEPDQAISGSVICLKTNSIEESQQLIDYLKTPEIKEVIRKNMASHCASKALFNAIADPLV